MLEFFSRSERLDEVNCVDSAVIIFESGDSGDFDELVIILFYLSNFPLFESFAHLHNN